MNYLIIIAIAAVLSLTVFIYNHIKFNSSVKNAVNQKKDASYDAMLEMVKNIDREQKRKK